MYNRNYEKRPPEIPSGYNGTAFSEEPTSPAPSFDRRPPERHEHGDIGDRPHRPPTPPDENCDCCDCLPAKIEPPCGKKPPLPSIFGGKLFPNGIGSEEILLLGLILLVSQSETETDALIYLIILLFC